MPTTSYKDVMNSFEGSDVKVTPFVSLVDNELIAHRMIYCRLLDENGEDVSSRPIFKRASQETSNPKADCIPEFDTQLKMIGAVDVDRNFINTNLIFGANVRPATPNMLAFMWFMIWMMRILILPLGIWAILTDFIKSFEKSKVVQEIEQFNTVIAQTESFEALENMDILDFLTGMEPVGNIIVSNVPMPTFRMKAGSQWYLCISIPEIKITRV
jgi:hypothetical protein